MTNEQSVVRVQSIITKIAQALVGDETSVRVDLDAAGPSTVFRLQVAPNDVGRLIGKQGRTARSLRILIGAICETQGVQHCIDIVEAGRD